MGITMAEITASMVKELRDKTGAGMMDCKTALKETKGDMEAAIDWLRKKGLSKAAGKADRVAAQGLVGLLAKGHQGAAVEVNSETDFVARNDQFQDMVSDITSSRPRRRAICRSCWRCRTPAGRRRSRSTSKNAVATIGENMGVRRTARSRSRKASLPTTSTARSRDGLGKIGALVALESAGDEPSLFEFGRQLAMHVAAIEPARARPRRRSGRDDGAREARSCGIRTRASPTR